jgi:hypothetical protein
MGEQGAGWLWNSESAIGLACPQSAIGLACPLRFEPRHFRTARPSPAFLPDTQRYGRGKAQNMSFMSFIGISAFRRRGVASVVSAFGRGPRLWQGGSWRS